MPVQTGDSPAARRQVRSFVDQSGIEHQLIPGYRSTIRPGWERMVGEAPLPATDDELAAQLREIASRVELGVRILRICGCRLEGKRVLVVGCGGIEEPTCLAGWGAEEVVGSDYMRPVREEDEGRRWTARWPADVGTTRAMLREQFDELGRRRQIEAAQVSLVHDDIASSSLRDASFDVVCSWRTLEHLAQPQESFAQMHRLLRPGGYAYHEYNPFFAVDGGHSLVTLDFPWGHVRLAEPDVARFLAEFRPEERVPAMNYYRRHLNRMTIGEMERLARVAGFEVAALIPRARTEDLLELTEPIYSQARAIYPRITLNDLVCRIVRVVLRRG